MLASLEAGPCRGPHPLSSGTAAGLHTAPKAVTPFLLYCSFLYLSIALTRAPRADITDLRPSSLP